MPAGPLTQRSRKMYDVPGRSPTLPLITEPANGGDSAHSLVGKRGHLIEDVAQYEDASTKSGHRRRSPTNRFHTDRFAFLGRVGDPGGKAARIDHLL